MFEYCPMINRNCAHAGTYNNELHCGLQTGSVEETKVKNIKICPRKLQKSTKKTRR